MNRIGIMQGRVLPECLDKLQVFPVANWEIELNKIKNIGFDYVELLFDKEMHCCHLLEGPLNLKKLGLLKSDDGQNIPVIRSVCLDYLTTISFINENDKFISVIKNLLKKTKNSNINILVIPFFDKNCVNLRKDFEIVLDIIKKKQLDKMLKDMILSLELNLSAGEIKNVLKKHNFENIKICYDIGNLRAMGYKPEDEIIELEDLISHIHIKDRKINGPNVMLGEGDVNIKGCLKSLKKINYKGLLILETPYKDCPYDEAIKNFVYVKNVIEELNR